MLAGVLSENAQSTHFDFASPIHRLCYFQARYQSKRENIGEMSIYELTKEIIIRMSPSKLFNSKSVSKEDKRPLERMWQMEFYRAASAILPNHHFISADAGTTFNLRAGFIDFYINDNLNFAFELLREGILLILMNIRK